MKVTTIGVIGCGNISSNYIRNARQYDNIKLAAFADIDLDRAKSKAEENGGDAISCTVDELLNNPEVSIILNLTIPKAHFSVAKAALLAGKSVYNEKPLTITKEEGMELLQLAGQRGLRVGGAPDTFLGAGIQTCRKVIEDGLIGFPVGATAFMMGHGHESWHPDPEFYYEVGGGPMFDMGPYYLTALITLLGPIEKVAGSTRISFPERTITSEKKFGKKVKVEVPTHVVGLLDFRNGAIGTIITSFDVWAHHMPCIEIYGSKGTLVVPDPNGFEGNVKLWTEASREWSDVPLLAARKFTGRSLGVADMAFAIANQSEHRANGKLTYHVLETMHAIHEASNHGKVVELSKVLTDKPQPLFSDSDLSG
ncbi:MAG: Gfo/Idh/MocA family oxidoreductase [Anaerolineae bacterium]|nr:Gfo/Idh/MocA family oxidoreductase [Anaerolineae bacterium]